MSTGHQLERELKAHVIRLLAPRCESDWKEKRYLECEIRKMLRQQRAACFMTPKQVISEAYLRGIKTAKNRDNNSDELRDVTNIRGWFKQICRNVIADVMRKEILRENRASD